MMRMDDLQNASRDELKTHWVQTNGLHPPPHIGRVTMARILICDLQWKQSGQSRAAIVRKLRKAVSASESSKPLAGSGTRLIREWNGREHVIDVLTDGYIWNGKKWRSLSAIAKEITGTKWSGPRFFGVAT